MLKFNVSIVTIFLFLVFVMGCSNNNPVESEEDHFEAIGLFIISGMDTIAKYEDLVVSGNINVTEKDSTDLLAIKFIEENGHVGVPPTDDWSLDWIITDVSVADVVSTDSQIQSYLLRISGKNIGQTNIRIIINHLEHKDYESADLPIVVVSGG
jgi:hypothetical protein